MFSWGLVVSKKKTSWLHFSFYISNSCLEIIRNDSKIALKCFL